MKDQTFITRQILDFRLGHACGPQGETALVQQFLSMDRFYVVADSSTTKEDWDSKTFGIHTEKGCLHLYVDQADAEQKAISIHSVLPDNSVMILPLTAEVAKSLISDYANKDIISGVWLCGKSPVAAKVGLRAILENYRTQSPSTIMAEQSIGEPLSQLQQKSSITESPSMPTSFRLIPEVRKTLSLPSAEERRKIDPSDAFTNLSRLLEKVIQANGLDMKSLDNSLGLPSGFTSNLCKSQRSNVIPKTKVQAYLQFFGLSEYLYVFKEQCYELAEELKASPQIDLYEIKPAGVKTVERFLLCDIVRGKDGNGAFVYRLSFKSSERQVSVVSSNNFKMIIGKEYELVGLELPETSLSSSMPIKGAADNKPCPLPSQDDMERAVAASSPRHKGVPTQKQGSVHEKRDSRSSGRNRYITETPEEKYERDRETVLSYIIKTFGCNSRDAIKKMSPFDGHEDVMASFAGWIEQKKETLLLLRAILPKS